MTPKVSVIVPVFNTSQYIAKCCRSLFEQTLDSIQYIFVDDGSSDGSLRIVEDTLSDYPNRSKQVKFVYHDKNRGVGAARHEGLKEVDGEYIIHCDSDDWVELDLYQILYETAISEGADIVSCAYSIDSEDGKCKRVVSVFHHDSKDLTFDLGPRIGSLVLKLISREFIVKNNLQISKEIKWGEDFCLSLKSLLLSEKTVCVNRPFYHYVQHNDSLTHTLTYEKCLNLIQCGRVIEDFLKEHDMFDNYLFQLNWLKFQLKQYFLIYPQTRDLVMWKSIYPECHRDICRYKTMKYLKVSAWLIVHHMAPIALLVLRVRDYISSFKNR